MNRRKFLAFTGVLVPVSAIVPSFLLQSCEKMTLLSLTSVVEGDFSQVLRLLPTIGNNTELRAQENEYQVVEGKTTQGLGYLVNSMHGPTIKVNRGELASFQLQNALGEHTNIHWHGLLLPAIMDGHPKDVFAPGAGFGYQFPINQRAGLYWYHPHPHGSTAKQVYKGLSGLFIVNDAEEASLGLPEGERELPLILKDIRLFPDYALNYSPTSTDVMNGYLGDRIVVNGVNSPVHEVSTVTYRLRIVNSSNARIYNLAFSDGRSFVIVGSDGGLLASSSSVTSVLFAPGERLDLLVNFGADQLGSELFLISKSFFGGGESQGSQEFKLLKFVVNKVEVDAFSIPVGLSVIEPLQETTASVTRYFEINAHMAAGGGHGGHSGMGNSHTINGKAFEMERVDESVAFGATEIWEVSNPGEPHPFHIHGVQFQILSREGGRNSVFPHEAGWKDTVLLMEKEKVRLIMRFNDYKGRFVFHCHNLEHGDDGMMLQMEIS